MPQTSYKRILLKVSGEAMMGDGEFGIDMDTVTKISQDIKKAVDAGLELCLVVGGGNIFRGMSGAAQGMDRSNGDYMGMLATVMNALALQNGLEQIGVAARVLSAIPMPTVCEPFVRARAIRHLDKGRVVIFAAGTGNPYFTTDTAAALRACEMKCDAMAKATQVDGVYSADPKTNPDAERYDELTYQEVLAKDLRVMDAAAITLTRDNDIPVIVFSIEGENSLLGVLNGTAICTTIKN